MRTRILVTALSLLLLAGLARAEVIVLAAATTTPVDGRTGALCGASPCVGQFIDLAGYKKVSIRFHGHGGDSVGVCQIYWRHDSTDEWTLAKTYNDPTQAGKGFVGFPDGQVAIYITYGSGAGIDATLKRTQ